MDWRNNLLVVEKILCDLDLPDLKSASATCSSWLTASAKAFEATSRVVIHDPRPEESPDLVNFLERFQRIKDFKFKLSEREATPNGLNCILADLPLETSSKLTHLTLDYEPTAEVLEAINSFLAQLTSRFPALKQLQICPNADPTEDLVSPSLEFLLYNLVPSAEHPNLKVLQVPVGPNSGSGIDWRFLTCLKKLERLDLLKFHVRGKGRFVHRQLVDFVRYFPPEAHVPELYIHLRLGIQYERLERQDRDTMGAAFKAIKPETCTLYIDELDGGIPLRSINLRKNWPVVDKLYSTSLKRLNVRYFMPLMYFTNDTQVFAHAFALVAALRHHRHPEHNPHVLLHVDLCLEEEEEEGRSSPSFMELECAAFGAPLIFRFGPLGAHVERFNLFSKQCLSNWTSADHGGWPVPVPNYNTLRKYTFGESQQVIIKREQFYPAERSTPDIVVPFPGRPMIHRFDGPGHRVWREIDFVASTMSSSIVREKQQSSWNQEQSVGTSVSERAPTSVLLVYTIE